MDVEFEVAYALSIAPRLLAMLGGGLLVLRAAPHLGRPAHRVGVALVALAVYQALLEVGGRLVVPWAGFNNPHSDAIILTHQILWLGERAGTAVVLLMVVRAAVHSQRIGGPLASPGAGG